MRVQRYIPRRHTPRGTLCLPPDCERLDDIEFQRAPSESEALRMKAARQAKQIAADALLELRERVQRAAKEIAEDRQREAEQNQQQAESEFRTKDLQEADRLADLYLKRIDTALEAERQKVLAEIKQTDEEREALLAKLAAQEKEIRRTDPAYKKRMRRLRNRRR